MVADPGAGADLDPGVDDDVAADQDVGADLDAGAEQQPGREVGGLKRRPAHRADVPRSLDRTMIGGMLAVPCGCSVAGMRPAVARAYAGVDEDRHRRTRIRRPAARRGLCRGRARGRRPRLRPAQGRGSTPAAATSRTSLQPRVLAALDELGRPRPTGSCEAVIICVPTPLTGSREPDHLLLDSATRSRRCCSPAAGVLSATYPGTTRERLQPILEESGLAAGATSTSPSRRSGSTRAHRLHGEHRPEAVGGSPACAARAASSLPLICDEAVLSSPEAAELSSSWRTSSARSTSPYVTSWAALRPPRDRRLGGGRRRDQALRLHALRPGPGMGGTASRSTPSTSPSRPASTTSTPSSSSSPARSTRPSRLLRRTDRARPQRASQAGQRLQDPDPRVSYKAGVGDIRESPSLKIAKRLIELGGDVCYHDPHVPALPTWASARSTWTRRWPDRPRRDRHRAPELDYEVVAAALRWWSTSAASPAASRRRTGHARLYRRLTLRRRPSARRARRAARSASSRRCSRRRPGPGRGG